MRRTSAARGDHVSERAFRSRRESCGKMGVSRSARRSAGGDGAAAGGSRAERGCAGKCEVYSRAQQGGGGRDIAWEELYEWERRSGGRRRAGHRDSSGRSVWRCLRVAVDDSIWRFDSALLQLTLPTPLITPPPYLSRLDDTSVACCPLLPPHLQHIPSALEPVLF